MGGGILRSLILPSPIQGSEVYRKISWTQVATGAVGFGVSLWALILHVQIKTGAAGELICDINETVNCTKIIGSEYGEFLGIPLGTLGMSFWAIVLAFAFLGKILQGSERYVRAWQLFVASVGGLSALVLAYLAYVVIQGVCEVCAVVQVTCIVHFVLTMLGFMRAKERIVAASSRGFFRVAGTTALAGLLPLTSAFAASVIVAKKSPSSVSSSSSGNKFSGQSASGDWYKGSADAKVEIVEFTDFECPYCQLLHEKLKEVQESVGKGNLRVVFRNWPLAYHKYSKALAVAARCAGRQGQFWDFADWAFESGRIYARDERKRDELFSKEGLLRKAESLGLKREEFGDCLGGSQESEKIAGDAAEAEKLGGKGTPFVLLNGKPYEGNWMNGDVFEAAIREAMK